MARSRSTGEPVRPVAKASQKLIVEIPTPMHRALTARARAQDRSVASLVRVALRAYLDGQEDGL